MALFSLKKIAALAAGKQVYLRGVALYNAGAVSHLTVAAGDTCAERVTARVQDRTADGAFDVEIGFNTAGDAVFFACDCAARERGACKHVVAALTHKYYRDMLGTSEPSQNLPTKDDPVVERLLDGYWQEARRAVQASMHGGVRLLCTLHPDGAAPSLSLQLESADEHRYAVKDITKFCEQMAKGEETVYGAHLRLVHHPEAFTADSRPLLRLVRAAADGRARRQLPLAPTVLDRLFSLYEGQAVATGTRTARFLRQDPPITVAVKEEDGTLLLSAPPFSAMYGEETLYLLWEDVLYAASPACTAAVRGLLAALMQAGGSLRLSSDDLAAFCGRVLPQVERFVTFTGDTALLSSHRPHALQAAVYLDRDGEHLTARVEFAYGDRWYPADNGDPAADGVRDPLAEWRVLTAVAQVFPARGEDGIFRLTETDDGLFDLLADGVSLLRNYATVYMSDRFRTARLIAPPAVSVGVRLNAGLLELDLDLGGFDPAELSELLASYRARRRYHRLRSGDFLSLDDPALLGLMRLGDGLGVSDRRLQSGRVSVPAFRAPFVDRVLKEAPALGYTRDEAARALLRAIKAVEHTEYAIPATLVGRLRGYQRTGFRWLRTMEEYGFGGILADDMGLGKTVQMITLFLDAAARSVTAPSLVVCPASLVLNWESELHRFAPSLTVRTVVGDGAARAALLRNVGEGEILVTSYDLLKRDVALYESLSFHYVVLDEAQYIKNHNTQNARAVKALHAVQRFALTGTPVENRLSELWSIFDFLMPGFLFSYQKFRERFELPAVRDGDCEALAALQRMCAPFLLRRLKREVLEELPPKTETERRIPLGEVQKKTYAAAALAMREELQQNGAPTRLQALTMLTRLRQICCDPSLCYENYHGESAKLDGCMELVREAVETGHRVLLFSQFTSMLAILEKRLAAENIPFYTLQGSTPREKRAAMVEAFNSEAGAPVFLISLKAGGTGLNLTAADVVIHYDPWWNVAAQNQASDRAHRIGQQRPVQVYKLIAEGTVEEKITALQRAKQSLADAVVHTDGLSLSALSDDELLHLLM